jgi:hypothetical protein
MCELCDEVRGFKSRVGEVEDMELAYELLVAISEVSKISIEVDPETLAFYHVLIGSTPPDGTLHDFEVPLTASIFREQILDPLKAKFEPEIVKMEAKPQLILAEV